MTDVTRRGADPEAPHLFPTRRIGDYWLSAQADNGGYACKPRVRHADLGRYDSVEVLISGPGGRIDPARVKLLPPDIEARFERGLGLYVPVSDLGRIEEALRAAGPRLEPAGPEALEAAVPLTGAMLRALVAVARDAVDAAGAERATLEAGLARLVEAAEGIGLDLPDPDGAPRPGR